MSERINGREPELSTGETVNGREPMIASVPMGAQQLQMFSPIPATMIDYYAYCTCGGHRTYAWRIEDLPQECDECEEMLTWSSFDEMQVSMQRYSGDDLKKFFPSGLRVEIARCFHQGYHDLIGEMGRVVSVEGTSVFVDVDKMTLPFFGGELLQLETPEGNDEPTW